MLIFQFTKRHETMWEVVLLWLLDEWDAFIFSLPKSHQGMQLLDTLNNTILVCYEILIIITKSIVGNIDSSSCFMLEDLICVLENIIFPSDIDIKIFWANCFLISFVSSFDKSYSLIYVYYTCNSRVVFICGIMNRNVLEIGTIKS